MIDTILSVPNIMLDIRNNSNDTALDLALLSGKKMNFDILLRKYLETTKINELNKQGLCYLSFAITACSLDFITHMIKDLNFDPNDKGNFEDDNRNYPLHQAIISKRIDVLRFLLSLPSINANIKDEQKNGDSALFVACKIPSLQSTIFLIESQKVDLNLTNKSGDNCLTDMIPVMKARNKVMQGNMREYLQIIFYIMTKKAFNLNFQGKNGDTLLHLLCDNSDILLRLLPYSERIDPNIKNDSGRTAIDCILDDYSDKYLNVVLIMKLGFCNINDKLIHSEVIFFIMKHLPTFEVFKKFVDGGLDLNVTSKEGILF